MMAIEKRTAVIRPDIPGTSMVDVRLKAISVPKEPWAINDPLADRICKVKGCAEVLRSDNTAGVCEACRRKGIK